MGSDRLIFMRRKQASKRIHEPDRNHKNVALGRFINYLMQDGKKSVAENVLYRAFATIKTETTQEPLAVFEKAMANVSPAVEVVSKRVGGANYQVPREVRLDRRFILASRWIITAARGQKGKPMADRLAAELIAAAKGEGVAVKKKQDTHRMAEANRAFAHFAW